MADNYAFLGISFYHNHRSHANDIFVLNELFGFNFYGIRNLLFIIQEDFLTDGFVDKKTLRFVGQLVFRVIGRPSGSNSIIRSNTFLILNCSRLK